MLDPDDRIWLAHLVEDAIEAWSDITAQRFRQLRKDRFRREHADGGQGPGDPPLRAPAL